MQSTGERWEFFHPSLSPFGYNETVAMEYYGLISEDGIQKSNSSSKNLQTNLKIFWYKWSDYSSDPKIPENAKTYCKTNFTDEEWIKLVDDDNIIKYIIVCEISGRPYMIQKMELEFYRKHSLSIPSKHPDIRHEERMKLRPWRTLHLCKCDHCDEDMLSVYPDSQNDQKVYCEKCYQKEIYG